MECFIKYGKHTPCMWADIDCPYTGGAEIPKHLKRDYNPCEGCFDFIKDTQECKKGLEPDYNEVFPICWRCIWTECNTGYIKWKKTDGFCCNLIRSILSLVFGVYSRTYMSIYNYKTKGYTSVPKIFPQHCLDIWRRSWSNICYMIAPKFEAEEGERCGYKIKKCRVSIPAFIHFPLFIIHQNRTVLSSPDNLPVYTGLTVQPCFDTFANRGNPY